MSCINSQDRRNIFCRGDLGVSAEIKSSDGGFSCFKVELGIIQPGVVRTFGIVSVSLQSQRTVSTCHDVERSGGTLGHIAFGILDDLVPLVGDRKLSTIDHTITFDFAGEHHVSVTGKFFSDGDITVESQHVIAIASAVDHKIIVAAGESVTGEILIVGNFSGIGNTAGSGSFSAEGPVTVAGLDSGKFGNTRNTDRPVDLVISGDCKISVISGKDIGVLSVNCGRSG